MSRVALKALAGRIARMRITRSVVGNLIYPTIAGCLRDEIQPDLPSPSGVAEALAWKSHAYLVLNEELRATGKNCAVDRMRSDRETRSRMLDVILSHIEKVQGDILEFGVYQGESLRLLAERCADRIVYGFDSFEGLPQAWWTQPKGAFKVPPPNINKHNVRLIQGLFDETLPQFLSTWSNRAALIHVDCDLYASTRCCLLQLLPRCQIGTVVLFDEYYNYPEFAGHEWLAWREIRGLYGVVAPCIAYDGKRAAFEVKHLGALGQTVPPCREADEPKSSVRQPV